MRHPSLIVRFPALVLGLALLASCGDAADSALLGPDAPLLGSSGPVLVECPADVSLSTTGSIGLTGGSIQLGNHEMSVPPLALLLPTEFTLSVPASSYMEIAITPAGGGDFEFRAPVSVTIDYSRCSRSNIDKAPLTVWHIDPVTKALLEDMGGVDDKQSRTITFQTDHLSHFSVAQ